MNNIYTLMRANVTVNFILFDLYNEKTHTNFEVKLCISSKRCINTNVLKEKINGFVCRKETLDDWLKVFEIIDMLFYKEYVK